MIKGLSAKIQEIRDEGIRPAIDFATQTSQELGIENHFSDEGERANFRFLFFNRAEH